MWINKIVRKSQVCPSVQLIFVLISCSMSCTNLTSSQKTMSGCDQNVPKNSSSQEDSSEDYGFIYSYLAPNVHNFSNSVTIGFLGAYGQAQVVLGALPLAVDAVNRAEGKGGVGSI